MSIRVARALGSSTGASAATATFDGQCDTSAGRQARNWLLGLLNWKLQYIVGYMDAIDQGAAAGRGICPQRSKSMSAKPPKSLRPPTSPRFRWWPFVQPSLGGVASSVSVISSSGASSTTLKGERSRDEEMEDVAPAAPKEMQQRQQPLFLPVDAVKARERRIEMPMLPTEALHRIASPAARASTPSPPTPTENSTPKLSLPTGAATAAALAEIPGMSRRREQRKPTKVRFLESAEWLLFDLDQPMGQPVSKSLQIPLRGNASGGESPQTPRAFHRSAGFGKGRFNPSIQPHGELTAATCSFVIPKANSANPHELGFSNACTDVLTPPFQMPALSHAGCDGFCGKAQEVATPRARGSSSSGFSFFESPPVGFGDDLQSD